MDTDHLLLGKLERPMLLEKLWAWDRGGKGQPRGGIPWAQLLSHLRSPTGSPLPDSVKKGWFGAGVP